VLVFSKENMKREKSGSDSIGRDAFLQATRSVWEIPSESARRAGHPSPFPLELPRRLIELYSFEGDVVLDPFCGSGTTCVAAVELKRRYVGYDIVLGYCQLACSRIWQAREIPQRVDLNKSSHRRDKPSAETIRLFRRA